MNFEHEWRGGLFKFLEGLEVGLSSLVQVGLFLGGELLPIFGHHRGARVFEE